MMLLRLYEGFLNYRSSNCTPSNHTHNKVIQNVRFVYNGKLKTIPTGIISSFRNVLFCEHSILYVSCGALSTTFILKNTILSLVSGGTRVCASAILA